METIDTMLDGLEYLKKKALKKKDFALALKIREKQLGYMMEMRKADPLDFGLLTNHELEHIVKKLKEHLAALKEATLSA